MLLLPVQADLCPSSSAARSPGSPSLLTDDDDSRSEHDRGSWRSLEVVGRAAVLGAMVEQRKRSSSLPPPPSGSTEDDTIATQRRERLDPSDDVFQKIR